VGDAYAVDGFEPELAFDFTGETYRTDGSATTFSGAMTHSATSLGTMVDGYGPELVTNGTFNTDSDWTDSDVGSPSASASISSGVINLPRTDGSNFARSYQVVTLDTSKYYELSVEGVSGSTQVRVGNSVANAAAGAVTVGTDTGTLLFTPQVAPTYLTLLPQTDGVTSQVDNISVRETPVIKWRPHNLLTYSEDFSNAAWFKNNVTVTANAAIAPDGTTTADLFSAAASSDNYLIDSNTLSLGVGAYTAKLWVKAASGFSGKTMRMWLWHLSSGGSTGLTTFTLTDEWQLIEISPTVTSTGSLRLRIDEASADAVDFFIWGAHLYRSDLGGMVDNPDRGDSYVPTTSAAVYLPRRGHYVYNGQEWTNRGLLLESEARTNLITYSIPDTNWSPIRASVSEGVALAPDGTMTASKGVEDTSTSATHRVDFALTVTDGSSYSWSVFAKAAERDSVAMEIGAASIIVSYARFDLSSGVVAEEVGGAIGYIEDFGNGWYRCTVNGLAGATDRVLIGICDGATQSYTGDGTSGIYLWGAQLEEDSTSSSYMPTNGATFTRAAETLTVAAADLPSTISPSGSKAALVAAGWTITDGGAV